MMSRRPAFVALGVSITTALVTTVLVIEALAFEFSAIVGLPVGLLLGIGVHVLTGQRYGQMRSSVRAVVDGAAGFGYAMVLLLAITYVDLPGAESITVQRLVSIALVTALAVAVLSALYDRTS